MLGGEGVRISYPRRIGHKPQLLKDIVKEMSAEGSTDPEAAFERLVRQERHVAGWLAIPAMLAPLDRQVLALLAAGGAPFARESLATLQAGGQPATIAKIRASIERQKKADLARGGCCAASRSMASGEEHCRPDH